MDDKVSTQRMDKNARAKNKEQGPYSAKHVRKMEALLQSKKTTPEATECSAAKGKKTGKKNASNNDRLLERTQEKKRKRWMVCYTFVLVVVVVVVVE